MCLGEFIFLGLFCLKNKQTSKVNKLLYLEKIEAWKSCNKSEYKLNQTYFVLLLDTLNDTLFLDHWLGFVNEL